MPNFTDVKAILDSILPFVDWDSVIDIHTAGGTHTDNPIGWETKQQLQNATVWRTEGPNAVSYRLIDTSGGKTAKDTYLIKALSGSFPRQSGGTYPQMPKSGPYFKPEQIQTIADWIDAGMPD